MKYIKSKYKLLIGERTSEEIKIKVGTVYPGSRNETMDIRGRDIVSGLPQTITIHSGEICEALTEPVSIIVAAAKAVLERTPPELSADIIDRGVVLTGGGALLHGLDQLLVDELKVPVIIADEPMQCVVKGTGIMLENLDQIRRNIRR
jgi:rod shape-determining protein MreB